MVQANNATFSLSENRMVAFGTHCQNRPHILMSSPTVAQLVVHRAQHLEVIGSMGQCFSPVCAHFGTHSRDGAILSRFGREGNSNVAQL